MYNKLIQEYEDTLNNAEQIMFAKKENDRLFKTMTTSNTKGTFI